MALEQCLAGFEAKVAAAVAQTFSLLYRRLSVCFASARAGALYLSGVLQTKSLRYSRLKVCATIRSIHIFIISFSGNRLSLADHPFEFLGTSISAINGRHSVQVNQQALGSYLLRKRALGEPFGESAGSCGQAHCRTGLFKRHGSPTERHAPFLLPVIRSSGKLISHPNRRQRALTLRISLNH